MKAVGGRPGKCLPRTAAAGGPQCDVYLRFTESSGRFPGGRDSAERSRQYGPLTLSMEPYLAAA
jgi:hypothetical protein